MPFEPAEEANRLAVLARRGDKDAASRLAEVSVPCVMAVVRRFSRGYNDREEIESVAWEALGTAIRTHRQARGSFFTYAEVVISNSIKSFMRKPRQEERLGDTYDAQCEAATVMFANVEKDILVSSALLQLIKTMSVADFQVLQATLCGEATALTAERLGVSRQAVSQRLAKLVETARSFDL